MTVLLLLHIFAAFAATQECFRVCKPFLYFWKNCDCARVPFVIRDGAVVAEPTNSIYPPDLQCIVFGYERQTVERKEPHGMLHLYQVVVVQGVVLDDNKGKDYPPRVFDLHRFTALHEDASDILEMARKEYELGSVENCFPEVAPIPTEPPQQTPPLGTDLAGNKIYVA
jgi:hypothetical protein